MLDLSDVTRAGDVAVITGAFIGDEVLGVATHFENFRGIRLTESVQVDDEVYWKDGDFVADVEFYGTVGTIEETGYIGFAVGTESGGVDGIAVYSDNTWVHLSNSQANDDPSAVASGSIMSTEANLMSPNRLQLLVIEDNAWVFLNGELFSQLDFSNSSGEGAIIPIYECCILGFIANVWTP